MSTVVRGESLVYLCSHVAVMFIYNLVHWTQLITLSLISRASSSTTVS